MDVLEIQLIFQEDGESGILKGETKSHNIVGGSLVCMSSSRLILSFLSFFPVSEIVHLPSSPSSVFIPMTFRL